MQMHRIIYFDTFIPNNIIDLYLNITIPNLYDQKLKIMKLI